MKQWKKWPYVRIYTKDLLSSQAVRQMSLEEFGLYMRLLFEACEYAKPGYLPKDRDRLMKLVNWHLPGHPTPEKVAEWEKHTKKTWDFVLEQFNVEGEFIFNKRLLDEFEKNQRWADNGSAAGKASVEARESALVTPALGTEKEKANWSLYRNLALLFHSCFGHPPLEPARVVMENVKELLRVGRTEQQIRTLIALIYGSKSPYRPNSAATASDPEKWEQWTTMFAKEAEEQKKAVHRTADKDEKEMNERYNRQHGRKA